MKNIFFYQTDIGEVAIAADERAVTNVYLNVGNSACSSRERVITRRPGLQIIVGVLSFDLPLLRLHEFMSSLGDCAIYMEKPGAIKNWPSS